MRNKQNMNLSKSQYMKGLQCPKALWLFKNRKDLAAEPGQRRLNLFATGHRVGDLAKRLFPGGAEVEYRQSDYQGMIDETAQLTKSENVIYEGSFSTNGVFVRADILVKNGEAWDIYEVKATAWTTLLPRASLPHFKKGYPEKDLCDPRRSQRRDI